MKKAKYVKFPPTEEQRRAFLGPECTCGKGIGFKCAVHRTYSVQEYDSVRAQLTTALARIEELKGALKFYANPENYELEWKDYMCHGAPHSYQTSAVKRDNGVIATTALKGGG